MCVTSLYYEVELRLILHSLSHLTLDLKVLAGGGRVMGEGEGVALVVVVVLPYARYMTAV